MDAPDFRHLLLQRLDGVIRRNASVNAHLRRADALPGDWEERVVLLVDDAALEGLDVEARSEIAETRAALRRLEAGTYGACAGCGADIGDDRLCVLPFAITCVRCARR